MYNDPVEKQDQQILMKKWIPPIISGTFRKYFTYMLKAQNPHLNAATENHQTDYQQG
jgi:ketol-acid reductoisomerase